MGRFSMALFDGRFPIQVCPNDARSASTPMSLERKTLDDGRFPTLRQKERSVREEMEVEKLGKF